MGLFGLFKKKQDLDLPNFDSNTEIPPIDFSPEQSPNENEVPVAPLEMPKEPISSEDEDILPEEELPEMDIPEETSPKEELPETNIQEETFPEEEKLLTYEPEETPTKSQVVSEPAKDNDEFNIDELFASLPDFSKEEDSPKIQIPSSSQERNFLSADETLYVGKKYYGYALKYLDQASKLLQSQNRKHAKLGLLNSKVSKLSSKSLDLMENLHENLMKIEEKLTR